MNKNRLEAFSDGVIAIIITIMVLELKAPHGSSISMLCSLIPIFLSYVLSFVFLGIYWNNHHHLLQAAEHVNGRILWANMHLLFWLSLIPFVTNWMGQNIFAPWPVAFYGIVLFFAACAYYLLSRTLIFHHGKNSVIAQAVGKDLKGKLSLLFYAIAVGLTFVNPLYSCAIYILVAIIWFVPDLRIEKTLERISLKKSSTNIRK